MNLRNASRVLVRALLCALPGVAPASAETPDQAPAGTVTETVIANLGSQLTLPREPVATEQAVRGNALWSIPLTALSATRDRPIFSPSRRPPPPPPAIAAPYVPPPPPPPAPPPEPDHPPLTLSGTVAGMTGGVIFAKEKDNTPVKLRIGEDYQGWVLRAVRGREATFEKNNRTATLALPLPEPPRTIGGGGRTVVQRGLVVTPSPTTDPNFWNR